MGESALNAKSAEALLFVNMGDCALNAKNAKSLEDNIIYLFELKQQCYENFIRVNYFLHLILLIGLIKQRNHHH
jgi:hypothetical protein